MQMEGGRGGAFASRDDDPFAGFWRSPMSSLFGGRDPFDDPFFTRPFGSVLGSSLFQKPDHFDAAAPTSMGPVIKELNSDGEEEDEEDQVPEDEQALNEKKSNDVIRKNDHKKVNEGKEHVKSQSFSYKKVTYGGVDGAYQTSTVSRRIGSDGLVLEESKAADKTTGQAQHTISRGIQNKGLSVTRMLKPDGKVETMQTLHNLNQDELAGFEESWRGNAGKHVGGGQSKNQEELKKQLFPGAGASPWDNSLLNWGDKMLPKAMPSVADKGTASSNNGAKKVVRILIE